MKQQLYKFSIFSILIITLFSCIEKDEAIISTQDLLIGNWKITQFKVNENIEILSVCDLMETIEFTTTNIIFTNFNYDEITSSCELEEEYKLPYTFTDDYKFKVNSGENGYITIEIIELNTDTLMLQTLVNGTVKISTYKRIERN